MSLKLGDLLHDAPPLLLQYPLALTQSVTGSTLDLVQRDGICCAFQYVGLVSGTGGPSLSTTVQESTDGTTWTEVIGPNGTTAGTFPTQTTSNQTAGILFQRQGRYLRAVNVVAGTTSPSFATCTVVFEQYKTLTPNPGT